MVQVEGPCGAGDLREVLSTDAIPRSWLRHSISVCGPQRFVELHPLLVGSGAQRPGRAPRFTHDGCCAATRWRLHPVGGYVANMGSIDPQLHPQLWMTALGDREPWLMPACAICHRLAASVSAGGFRRARCGFGSWVGRSSRQHGPSEGAVPVATSIPLMTRVGEGVGAFAFWTGTVVPVRQALAQDGADLIGQRVVRHVPRTFRSVTHRCPGHRCCAFRRNSRAMASPLGSPALRKGSVACWLTTTASSS